MSRDFTLLLMGATIALVSGLITALVQHRLSLKRERVKRDWEKKDREAQERRISLLENTQLERGGVKKSLLERQMRMLRVDLESREFEVRQKHMGQRGVIADEREKQMTADILDEIGRELRRLRDEAEKDIEEIERKKSF
jgi:hypothetical protein